MTKAEFVGLTIKDIDLKEKTINIDHQLQRTSQMQYIIEPPKTEAGNRVIPMQEEVCECFKRIIQKRRKPKVEPMVGGKVDFCTWIRMRCLWLPCIGRNIFSIL